ncbi:MAG: helix-turn-helix domain-containing protein [Euryarchaeota archaeon]|nr:helix-turn-helix domain-containing protein [Euryarchaeota archaeon]
MSLAEVVFEAEKRDYAMCRFTAEHPDVRAIFRPIKWGREENRIRGVLTIVGATEVTNSLVKELKEAGQYEHFEIMSIAPYAIVLSLEAQTTGAGHSGVELAALTFSALGSETILEPIIFDKGKARVTGLCPQVGDTKEALLRLQELQKVQEWTQFRVIRVGTFDPVGFGEKLRPVLDADQEELMMLAISMGYYEVPKRCNLEDIAGRVGLSVSPVHKKLKEIEHTLINSYLDPAYKVVKRRRRTSLGAKSPGAALMREIILRLRLTDFAPAGFTKRYRESRLIYQILEEDTAEKRSTGLFVFVAAQLLFDEFLKSMERGADTISVETLGRDADHLSLRVRQKILQEGIRTGPMVLHELVRRFGRDSYVKPIIIEDGELLVRMVTTRKVSSDDILRGLTELQGAGGIVDFDLLNVKDVTADTAIASIPQQEKITPRQEEVLKIAHAMGYYRTPRECTLEDIAHTLGISTNAVHKNLTAAEQKIACGYFAGTSRS